MSAGAERVLDSSYPWPRPPAVRSMLIRAYLRLRSQRARRFLLLGGVVAAAALSIVAVASNLKPAYCYLLTAAGVLGMADMAGALLYLDQTKCPNCRSRLGIQIANQYRFGRLIAFCPFCGVGFDKCEVRSS